MARTSSAGATILQIFIGVDVRQPLAATVLQASIYRHASQPVAITWLLQDQLPVKRRGLTDFTFTRYLPPWLCGFEDWSLFLDADMIVLDDIVKLFDLADPEYAVQVVKCKKRFEWPSLMLFNNMKCLKLTPDYIEHSEPQQMDWGPVGALPPEWNFCVGYDAPLYEPKVLHYTMGLPVFDEVKKLGYVEPWQNELRAATSTVPWKDLMGTSVHAEVLNGA